MPIYVTELNRHIVCQLLDMSVFCDCRIFRLLSHLFTYFSKMHISHIFLHKLAFSKAILTLFVFLLSVSIRFCYLDHLIANIMAPSMCRDPCGTRCSSWF